MPRPLAHRRLYDESPFACSTIELIETPSQRDPGLFRLAPRRTRLFHAPLLFRVWHLASLDAPTVAILWSLAFAWTANVRLPWWVLVVLPLGIWAIYVTDRLLDARTGMQWSKHDQLRERHLFHWRHRHIFALFAFASAVVATWIVFHLMPRTTREHDSLLAACSLLYFTRVHSGQRFLSVFSKELAVGIIFTCGCALPVFSRAHFSPEFPWWPLLMTTVFFALLAWFNCYAIDRWESHDANSSRYPIAMPALLLAASSFICSAILAASHSRSASVLASGAAAALLLAALDRVRNRITPVTLRAAADLALLTPALLLPLSPLFRQCV